MHLTYALRLIAALVVAFLFSTGLAKGQQSYITIDEEFSDWESVDPLHEADDHDDLFQRIWVTNDDRYLFLSLEVASEIVLQSSDIVLYIDSDDDAETGRTVHAIGADLEWRFGERAGFIYLDGTEFEIRHPVIGVVNAPTVSSTRFEIALRRDATYGSLRIFDQDDIRIALGSADGEAVVVQYTFQEVERPRAAVSLTRPDTADVRIVSYNVLRDGPFLGRDSYFTRILSAIQPDVIGFQEMYSTPTSYVKDWLERDVPGEDGAMWYVERGANDVMLASRYPILGVEAVEHHDLFAPRTAVFTVDLRPRVERDLVVYVTHTACCENDVARQEQLDAMMGHLREAKTSLPHGTPFMLIGDFNLVTFESQRRTVLDGAIADTDRYGPAFPPDWDETSLADLKPLVAGLPMSFTWHDEGSSFSPGRLDYIFYSDYAMSALGGFVLFTPAMNEAELTMYGLSTGDSRNASDHLPLVGDFRIETAGAENPLSLDGAVYSLIAGDGGIIAAGAFSASSNAELQRVAQWDGNSWQAVGGGLDGQINALARLPDGSLYAGGQFPFIGVEQQVSVRYLAEDGTWRDAGEDLKGRVNAFAVGNDGLLIAGGWFSAPARHIAAFDGESWQAFDPEPNGEVHTLAFHTSGDLFAGGFFTAVDGTFAAGIARWDGEAWTALGDGLHGTVRSIAVAADGNVYAAGEFTIPSAVSGTHHVARWDGSTWTSMLQLDDPQARVYAIAIGVEDALVVGGSFERDGRHHALLKLDGGTWRELDLDVLSGAVHALLVRDDGMLVVGGDFHYGGESRGRNIALVDAFGPATAVEPYPTTVFGGLSIEIYPNPAADRATLVIRGADGLPEVSVYDVLARRVRAITASSIQTPSHSMTLEIADLPAGLYIVRVRSGSRSAVSTFVVAR